MNHILQRRNKHDSFVELLRTSCFMISSTQVVPSEPWKFDIDIQLISIKWNSKVVIVMVK